MRKFALLLAVGVTLGLAACQEDEGEKLDFSLEGTIWVSIDDGFYKDREIRFNKTHFIDYIVSNDLGNIKTNTWDMLNDGDYLPIYEKGTYKYIPPKILGIVPSIRYSDMWSETHFELRGDTLYNSGFARFIKQ